MPFDDRVGDARGEQTDGSERVVVAGDHIVDAFGRAVGVNNRDDRNAEPVGFGDRDLFLAHVNDEERIGEARHVLDAREVLI